MENLRWLSAWKRWNRSGQDCGMERSRQIGKGRKVKASGHSGGLTKGTRPKRSPGVSGAELLGPVSARTALNPFLQGLPEALEPRDL